MKSLSEQMNREDIDYQMEKQAIWNWAAQVALPWVGRGAKAAWKWARGSGGLAKGVQGPVVPNVASRAVSAVGRAPGAIGAGLKDIAKNRKMDMFMYGGLGTAVPLAMHYGVTAPALKEQEQALETMYNKNLDLARANYMYSEQQNQLRNQRGVGGLAGAGIGGILGNMLSRGLGMNQTLGTVLGGAAGSYLGSQYGPQAYNYASNRWGV